MSSRNTTLLLLLAAIAAAALYITLGTGSGPQPLQALSEDSVEWIEDEPEAADSASVADGAERSASEGRGDEGTLLPVSREDRPQLAVSGRVVDRSGQPIAAAEVRIELSDASSAGFRGRRGRERVREPFVTGRDGIFRFAVRGFEELRVTLVARHESFAPALAQHVLKIEGRDVDTGDLPLAVGGRVVGRVVDGQGVGVAGAEVEVAPGRGHELSRNRSTRDAFEPVLSDALGYFVADHLTEGAYRVQASAHQMQRGSVPGTVDVEDERETDVGPILLGPGVEITGYVYNVEGKPIGGARVEVANARRGGRNQRGQDPQPGGRGGGRDRGRASFVRERTRTADDGSFSIDHLPVTTLRIDVQAEGYLSWEQPEVDASTNEPIIVTLEPGLSIHGVVLDGAGSTAVPEYAARVTKVRDLPDEASIAAFEERLRELARNSNQGPEAAARLRSLRERLAQSGVGGNERRGGNRGGRDRGGRDGGRGNRGRGFARTRPMGDPEPHPEGLFHFPGLDEGVYVVEVSSPDHARYTSAEIELRRDLGDQEVEIRVERGFTISGRVHAAGEAVAGARVELYEAQEAPDDRSAGGATRQGREFFQRMMAVMDDGLPRGPSRERTQTDADGGYSFGLQPGGRYIVVARSEGMSSAATEAFVLDNDIDAADVELAPSGRLEGQVLGVAPSESRTVQVVAFRGPRNQQQTIVAADGTYSFESLQPGSYMVRAYVGDADSFRMQQMRELFSNPTAPAFDVEVPSGGAVTYNVMLETVQEGAVEGIAFLNGEPARGLQITLRPSSNDGTSGGGRRGPGGGGSGWGSQQATTDAEGRFGVRNLPVGEYVVLVRSSGGARRPSTLHSESVTVLDGRTSPLRIELFTGRIQGEIVNAEGAIAEEAQGTVLIFPGIQEAPEDPRAFMQNQPMHVIRVRAGAFEGDDLLIGPALLQYRPRGQDAIEQAIEIPRGTVGRVEIRLPSGGGTDK